MAPTKREIDTMLLASRQLGVLEGIVGVSLLIVNGYETNEAIDMALKKN